MGYLLSHFIGIRKQERAAAKPQGNSNSEMPNSNVANSNELKKVWAVSKSSPPVLAISSSCVICYRDAIPNLLKMLGYDFHILSITHH
jgi:hypothetical protein